MTHPAEAKPPDELLERLLHVERSLEARVKAAEEAARDQVAAAREAARRAEHEQHRDLETMARSEEAADLEQHAAQLRRIEEESQALVARFSGIAPSVIDRLAARAIALLLDSGRG